MPKYHNTLQADKLFHSIAGQLEMKAFLNRCTKYILPIAGTYAWCLLPNHFHFMIRIKNINIIEQYYKEIKTKKFHLEIVSDFLMEQFANCLNSYSKSFNKVYERKGALFMDYLRRIEINNENQFGATIFYIHKNPVHHGYCKSISEWKWSSYKLYSTKEPTLNCSKEVIEWFGNKESFINYHQQPVYPKDAVVIE